MLTCEDRDMNNTTQRKRLTPKQQETFLGVADYWGSVFYLPSCGYDFMRQAGLVCQPTEEALDAHYDMLLARVLDLRTAIIAEATLGNFAEAKQYAAQAVDVQRELNDRGEDRDMMATLSFRGHELAEKLRAAKV